MKKPLIILFLFVTLLGCPGTGNAKSVTNKLEPSKSKIQISSNITPTSRTDGGERFVLKVELSQSRLSLDPFSHLSDAINAETFEIFTDKQAYDAAVVGQPLFEAFRTGSFFIKGSWSSWNLEVVEKRIIKE